MTDDDTMSESEVERLGQEVFGGRDKAWSGQSRRFTAREGGSVRIPCWPSGRLRRAVHRR